MTQTTVTINVRVRLPKLPNYVFLEKVGAPESLSVPVETLSDDELKALGQQWTASLVEHARKRRGKPVDLFSSKI